MALGVHILSRVTQTVAVVRMCVVWHRLDCTLSLTRGSFVTCIDYQHTLPPITSLPLLPMHWLRAPEVEMVCVLSCLTECQCMNTYSNTNRQTDRQTDRQSTRFKSPPNTWADTHHTACSHKATYFARMESFTVWSTTPYPLSAILALCNLGNKCMHTHTRMHARTHARTHTHTHTHHLHSPQNPCSWSPQAAVSIVHHSTGSPLSCPHPYPWQHRHREPH